VHAALSRKFEHAPPGAGGFIAHWIDLLDESRDKIVAQYGDSGAATRALEEETVRLSLQNLRTFPPITERERAGLLTLHGAYFAIAEGTLHLLNETTGAFAPA
jgi:carbonic anhydrase